MIDPRPSRLAEVASRSLDTGHFEFELADFLHEFSRQGDSSMLTGRPAILNGQIDKGAIFDAYLAAVAVYLSSQIQAPAPLWASDPARILPEPWFASPGRHMRALLLVESPAAFRERNLFVSANALSVA